MTTVVYKIRLNEPAIFSKLEGDPNSAVSYPYIPGSAIRGMVIGLYTQVQRQRTPSFVLGVDDGQDELFFSPQTRYLNAYPMIEGGRSLPVPATWTKPKYKNADETDQAIEANNEDKKKPIYITDNAFGERDDEEPKRKPKNISGFTTIDDNSGLVYQPETVINVHNTRARRLSAEQQVFRYEALAEGQTFMGAILCDTEGDAILLADLLTDNAEVVLGGSRTAGYGSATLTSVQIIPDWVEVHQGLITQVPEIVLTFLSDALLRDEQGVYVPTPQTLKTQLAQLGIECQLEPISIKTTWIGGFNRKWGLPLPQMIGIEQGSVVRLTEMAANEDALWRLITYGIGDRREDGFGRVALGWQRRQYARLKYIKYAPQQTFDDVELSDESKFLFNIMRERIRERELDEKFSGILYDKQYTISGNISRTQLSRLRSVIANELSKDQPSLAVITAFITQLSNKSSGREFDSARIGSQRLSEWLKKPTFEGLPKRFAREDHILQLVDLVLERAYRERDN